MESTLFWAIIYQTVILGSPLPIFYE